MNIRRNPERGASAVEMALVAPFLLIILLGIIEFGYVFGQYNEVRHAAREGARFAAVSNSDFDTNANGLIDDSEIRDVVCGALNLPGNVEITTQLNGTDSIGQTAEITVTAYTSSLSGAPIISSFVPDELSNTATFRLEQLATWIGDTFGSSSLSACP